MNIKNDYLETAKMIWSCAILPTLKTVAFVAVIVLAFFLGAKWQDRSNEVTVKPLPDAIKLNSCSISVTERGELMIIDRATSKIYIYEQTAGMQIFKSYSSYMINNKPQ